MKIKLRLHREDDTRSIIYVGDAALVIFQDCTFNTYGPDEPREWLAYLPGPDAYHIDDHEKTFPTLIGCIKWYLREHKIRDSRCR